MKKIILLLFISLIFSSAAFGWGTKGHYIVAEIGQRHLTHNAQKEVARLLGNRTLPQVANWADELKSDPAWKKADRWHYVNVSKGKQYLKSAKQDKVEDVISAIVFFAAQLKNKKSSDAKKAEALKFLVHFVGDIHQPMHNGFAEDRGGNDLRYIWFRNESNLHRVWDDELIEMQKLSFREYSDFIDNASSEQLKQWQNSQVVQWHKEAREILKYAYLIETGKDWEYRYSSKVRQMHDQSLLKAGIRLAGLLNSIF